MKRTILTFYTILLTIMGFSQPDTLNQRIFLLGDAGELRGNSHPVIDWLSKKVDWNDERNTILYLGDNIYPLGLPLEGDPSYPEAKRILDYQINLVKGKKGKAFFIPGNHDWRNGKLGGWEQAMNQQDYINSMEQKNIQAWPLNGCPGPVPIEISDKIVLALIDSQWFLYLHDKPGPGSNCEAKTIDEFQVQLAEIAAAHPNQLLVVAMHHPIVSYGVHGGDYTWKEHLFPFTAVNPNLWIPLPILGSIYPLTRGVFGNVQDLKHPLYKAMGNVIQEAIKKHPHAIVVAGHDHSLQMIMRKDSVPYIVSGAGVGANRASDGKYLVFSDVNLGFSVIEVWKSGKAEVKFYNINSADFNAPTFKTALKDIVPTTAPATVDTTKIIFDSVAYIPADSNLKGSGFKHFMIGKNYRKEWTEPVRVKVLDMSKELGGLTPVKQGGGKQTKSLRVKDSSGKEWALRSVIKSPEAAIPPDLRQTFVKDIVQDGISASYPYGALSMETFSKAAGIPYLKNRLVYLPDDPRLDRFRADFKNMMAFMEEREPAGVKKTDNTDELVLKLAKDNDDHVDQREVLKIRLLDNFVMDLDRHEGQWLWATRDTGKGKIYYPIPKDRDQVFYTNQGLIPKFARKPAYVPELQGFRKEALNIKTFNKAARNFDRTFLTELTWDQWKIQIDSFLTSMTDEVIETALKQQPPEIQQYSASKIVNTLKARRKYLEKEMKEYYEFISKFVTVVGSNERELFTITKNDNGTVRVVVNKIDKDNNISSKIYDRIFDPKVTKEIRIFGLNDDDRFVIEGVNTPIKIRIVGGSGNDEFINNSTGNRQRVFDASFEKNTFSGNRIKKTVVPDPQVNRYDRLNFKYNYFNPSLAFEYNIDDGVFLGPEFLFIKQGFRKEPYSQRHYFMASRALQTESMHFIYNADFIKVFRNTDILIRTDIRAPINVTNFFGLGNNTEFNKELPNKTWYYRARYNISNMSVYLRRQLQSWMRINFGPSYQTFNLDSAENAGRFVTSGMANIDLNTVYNKKRYLGADLRLDINSKNNVNIPTRGFMLDLGVRPLFGLNGISNTVTQVNMDMRVFMSLATNTRLVLATRLGWGANYGKFEFPQAMYLGQTENLRGFRKQRFAGKSMLFNNTELRVRLFDFNTYLFPGSFGMLVFNDIGRVWVDGEESSRWHDGYGAGIWLAPVKRFVMAATLAYSKEEKNMIRVTFGFQF